ncbi:MAG: winged helix-turn-helix transcriptional regulator [Syntrophaceae bacterium]|nr:winged helix-turn-helix transcriptional regulator [Syntrophaceae bacterium]
MFQDPKFADKAAGEAIDKTIDKDLSITEKTVIKLIATNPSITQKEMAKQLKLTEIGIRYNTSKLKSKGILRRTGGKKAGRWEVVK